MKWNCTKYVLSAPVAMAIVGLGITTPALVEASGPSSQSRGDYTTRGLDTPADHSGTSGGQIHSGIVDRLSDVAKRGGRRTGAGPMELSGCADPAVIYSNLDVNVLLAVDAGVIFADVVTPKFMGDVGGIVVGVANAAPSDLLTVDVSLHFWEDTGTNLPVVGDEIAIVTRTLSVNLDAPPPGLAAFGLFDVDFDPSEVFPVPATGSMWAGIEISNPTFSGAGSIDDLAWVCAGPPTCGTSEDVFWFSDAPGDLFWFGGWPANPWAGIAFEVRRDLTNVPGACCLPKENGEDADPLCSNDLLGGQCLEIDGAIFHPEVTCAEVTCPTQVECPKEDDPCPPCDGDLDDNGVVDSGDLLELLACWGPVTPGCECADLDGNGVIDSGDLLELLAAWGPCPAPSEQEGTVFNEDEPCGERINDGCSIGDYDAQTPLVCGDIVCGTAWTATEQEDCPEPQGHVAGTCGPDGALCGGQGQANDPAEECWCDTDCWTFGDCCLDICDECYPIEFLTRDTDWYSVTVKEKSAVTWHIHAEFPATAFVGWISPDCGELIILDEAEAGAKILFELEACLQPGIQYFLFIAPTNFEGLPCEGEAEWGNAYTVEVECNDGIDCPKGGCCFDVNCVDDYDRVACIIDGGQYRGDGTVCGGPVAADGDHNLVWCSGACCTKDTCVETTADNCINGMLGAYRGGGTTCATVDCRDCTLGGMTWENQDDVCDEKRDIDPFNGGCNFFEQDDPSRDPAFEQVCCGDVVGGQIWSFPSCADVPEGEPCGRDLDWRHLTLKEDSVVLLTIEHGFDAVGLNAVLFIAQAGCPPSIISSGEVANGEALIAQLDAGKYYVIVSAPFAPAAGPFLECGPNSWYILDIACGEIDEQVCSVGCDQGFISHGGYPIGFCSCEELACAPAAGVVDAQNPNLCCPGICNFCTDGICDVAPCEQALDVTANINGPPVNADNTNAVGEGPFPPGSPSCHWINNPSLVHGTLWFKFDAPPSGEVTINVCGSSGPFNDSLMAAFSGPCHSLLEVGCDDWGCQGDAPPYYSSLTLTGLNPGQTYHFSVSNSGGWGGSVEGPFVLEITSP